MAGNLERDWFLQDWMKHRGKRQADLTRERGWPKARVSKYVNGQIPYRREVLNDLADWLGIEPFELLMHPKEATAIRVLRETAAIIVGDRQSTVAPPPSGGAEEPADAPPPTERTGTEG